MPILGPLELGIILLIVVILFGASRVGDLVGGIGKGIRQFRAEVREDPPAVETSAQSSTTNASTTATKEAP